MLKNCLQFLLIIFLFGCGNSTSNKEIDMNSLSMKLVKQVDGKVLYREEPFSGKLVKYDSFGNIKFSSLYVNGLKEGKTIYLNEGKITIEVVFDSGMRVGKYLEFYPNQDTMRVGFYSKGKKDSTWTRYFEDGQIESIIRYTNDSMNGKFIIYHQNGHIKTEGEHLDGKEHGRWDFYDSLGRWTNGGNYDNGVIITRITEDPPRAIHKKGSAILSDTFDNGQIKHTYPRKNEKPHGDWIWHYENGQVRKIVHFENGKAQGKVERFYEDGSLKNFETRIDGTRVGETKSFYTSGKLESQGQYEPNGKKDGTWLFYSETGDLVKKIEYRKGKLIKEDVF